MIHKDIDEIILEKKENQERKKVVELGKWFVKVQGVQETFQQIKRIFSWYYEDMPSLDENFITHSLIVNKYAKHIKKSYKNTSRHIFTIKKGN